MNNKKPRPILIITILEAIAILSLLAFIMSLDFTCCPDIMDKRQQLLLLIFGISSITLCFSLTIISIILCIKCIAKNIDRTKAIIRLVVASLVLVVFIIYFFKIPYVKRFIDCNIWPGRQDSLFYNC